MSATQTVQQRRAVLIDGVQQFEISVGVTQKGDLPSAAIFVFQINDASDPKEDAFARVANIADFEEVGPDRVKALATDQTLYRAASTTLYYGNLATAVNAQDTLKSRIDQLVADWAVYQSQFETVSETTTHPQLSDATFTAAVNAYNEAVDAQTEAETARDAAKTAYDASIVAASDESTEESAALTRYTECLQIKSWYDAFYLAMSPVSGLHGQASLFAGAGQVGLFITQATEFKDGGQTFRTACTSTPPSSTQKATFDALLASFNGNIGTIVLQRSGFSSQLAAAQNALSDAASHQAELAVICAAKLSEYQAAQQAKTVSDVSVANARTAYEDAQTAYEVAQQNVDEALAAVHALKPTWTPTSTV